MLMELAIFLGPMWHSGNKNLGTKAAVKETGLGSIIFLPPAKYYYKRHPGLEVEQWSDNRTLTISVDQSPLGACIYVTTLLLFL